MALKLYDFWRSSAAYRARIGFHLKGAAYISAPIALTPGKDEQRAPEYTTKNPLGRVPALETDAGLIGQSLAILEWLDETYPEPPFLPGDAWTRAQIRAFALTIACDVHPLNNISVLGRLKSQFSADEESIGEWYRHWISLGLAALETEAAARSSTPFAFGDAPTLADICLVPQMMNARRFKTDLSPFPRLVAFDERARAHPAFIAAAPDNQIDAVKP